MDFAGFPRATNRSATLAVEMVRRAAPGQCQTTPLINRELHRPLRKPRVDPQLQIHAARAPDGDRHSVPETNAFEAFLRARNGSGKPSTARTASEKSDILKRAGMIFLAYKDQLHNRVIFCWDILFKLQGSPLTSEDCQKCRHKRSVSVSSQFYYKADRFKVKQLSL